MSFLDNIGLREIQKPTNTKQALRNQKYAERTQYFVAVLFLLNGELLTATLIGIVGLLIRVSKHSVIVGILTIILGSLLLIAGIALSSTGTTIAGVVIVFNGIMSVMASAFLKNQVWKDVMGEEKSMKKIGLSLNHSALKCRGWREWTKVPSLFYKECFVVG